MNWIPIRFHNSDEAAQLLQGEFSTLLVFVSVLTAVYASWSSLQIAGRAKNDANPVRKHLSLFAGSLSLGGGVWAMHFIGMLAFHLPTRVDYEITLTLLSLTPSIAASWVALSLIVKSAIRLPQLLLGGVLVGAGIGLMHYAGMAAMQMNLVLRYDPLMFALSIVVAVGLAILALWIRFGVKRLSGFDFSESQLNLLSGVVMGLAISGMHYTGMAAARFIAPLGNLDFGAMEQISFLLAIQIAIITFTISSFGLGVNMLIKYKDALALANDNETRLRATMATAIDPIISFDTRGEIVSANKSAETRLGWRCDDLLGQSITVLLPGLTVNNDDVLIHSGDGDHLESVIGVGRETVTMHKTGKFMPVRLAIGHVQLDTKNLYVAFISDISQRIDMENDLRQAKESAEHAANIRQLFLTNMSHEIRTPMNAIIGFSRILTADESLSSQQQQHLKTISVSATSLLHLLDDILDSAKLEKGKMELETVDFSLLEELNQVITVLWVQASAKGLELRSEISPQLEGVFQGAPDKIRQVLTNLIGNAIKFTDKGNVTLTVYPEGNDVVFAVSDTGIGIPENRLQAIFDPFSQADSSVNRRFGGTGLGTSISKQLVELMGGTISVTSELNVGSCFTFRIPLEAGSNAAMAAETEQVELPPLTILVADDVAFNVDLLRILLERAGHTVITAADGQATMAKYNTERIDVILMDVQMPVLDGLTATRQIRAQEKQQNTRRMPIIALTAGAFAQDKEQARLAGMDGFVTKPVDEKKLFIEIARVIGLTSHTTVVSQKPKQQSQPSTIAAIH
ncbi:MAG: MHYT domain-containing protein [Gammaproteobacteria bacterium]